MPDSEERSVEKLLRSAAHKRRAEAGSPAMHPATRETLLTEVRRQYGTGRQSAGRPWWWRLAPALAVVAVLATGSWLALRNESSAPLELAKLEAPTQQRQAAESAPVMKEAVRGELSGSLTLDVPAQDKDARVPVVFVGENTPLLAGRDNQVPGPGEAVRAPASEQILRTDTVLSAEPSRGSDSLSFAMADEERPLPVSEEQPQALGWSAGRAALQPTPLPAAPANRIRQAESPEGFSAKGTVADESEQRSLNANEVALPVLQSFAVMRTGRRVQFIDADGSVYEGDLETGPAAETKISASGVPVRALGVEAEAAPATARQRLAPEPRVVSDSFDVSGTNRTLQLSVRFQGQIVLTTEQAQARQNAFSNILTPALQRTSGERLQSPSQPIEAGVQGMLQLVAGTTLRVEAVPTAP